MSLNTFRIPSRRKSGFHIDVVPLIDVVFVILIFNIMSSTLTQQTGVDVNKPQAQSASELNRRSILVAVTRDGGRLTVQVQLSERPASVPLG